VPIQSPTQVDSIKCQRIIYILLLESYHIMVRLVMHLVREVRLCGPMYLRWMYPVEWYMKILKGYVKNNYRLEASMIERYIA